MKILVFNCGSSSLKYQLFNMENESVLAKGLVERIGLDGSKLTHYYEKDQKVNIEKNISNHDEAISLTLETLCNDDYGVINNLSEIRAIGHRVVHGGEKFKDAAIVDDDVLKGIEETIPLAPLHNPANLLGITACIHNISEVKQVAVFDTAFHQTIDKHVYLYAIPYSDYENHKIRRYGFHGTSHKYVSNIIHEFLDKKDLKIISCHLGNGASVCAIQNGESVETSMGFTPLEGLMMGTRSGDLDPTIVTYLMEKHNFNTKEVNDYLNKKSGALGLSGISSDFRDILKEAEKGNELAQVTLDKYCHRIKKYIGAYASVMNGVDAVIFTAGIGENSIYLREKICSDMDVIGLKIDKEKNKVIGELKEVSSEDSKAKIFIIPTNEELLIARETFRLTGLHQ